MLKYEYINKEWIVSPTAGRVYRASATLSVALFFGWCALLFVGGIPSTIAPVMRLLLLADVLGAESHLSEWSSFCFASMIRIH